MSAGNLDAFAQALRPYMLEHGREMLKQMLSPPFGTHEARARVAERVDALSDDEVEAIWANIAEAESRRCPECGRPYERLEPFPRYQPVRSSSSP